ncbi:hypothetical protein AB0M32_43990 [Streptomyces sp. NPDC051985]|uniref:hypothetical protein n=1 Tax=Streptomyces sp. NPDC051985 TaxID=3155807 RepID=UPI00343C4C97
MTSPAVLPGTAVRAPRTATGRRALQLALLVGGLLALGLLCGERAQAAEGVSSTPSLTSVVAQKLPLRDVLTPHKAHKAHKTPEPQTSAPAPRKATVAGKSVTETVPVVPPVVPVVDEALKAEQVHKVVRSVTDSVTAVTESLDETVRQVSELPAKVSVLPAVPVVQLPELPVVSELPGELLPAPVVTAPRHAQPQPQSPVTPGTGHEKSGTRASVAAAVSYGPRLTVVTLTSDRAAQAGGHGAARPVGAPSRPAPAGDPDGALGKSAVDGAASRHGDAHAVTFVDRAPLRLVTGAAARVDAAGTRDRYRDIPVFPG